METTTTKNTGPIEKYSLGSVHVTIWENTTKIGEPFLSVRIENRYKDEDGNWKSSNSFSRDALPVVSDLASKAHDRVKQLQSQQTLMHNARSEVQR